MENCVFCKIMAGEIPSQTVYEDDEMVIFRDAAPIAPVHLLCVPREHFAHLDEMDDRRAALLGRMFLKIAALQNQLGLEGGYRLVINQGENAGQTVQHLHIHILGGKTLPWG